MVVVKVELHSARDGHVEELGRMLICNDGTSKSPGRGDYDVYLGRKGHTLSAAVYKKPLRKAHLTDYPRLTYSVWELVRRAVNAVR